MQESNQDRNPYHPDVPLFLVLIPFISAFNYYLTYSNIQWSAFLLLTFSIDTAQGYAAWWAVRAFILFLDRKWGYDQRPLYRLLVQLVATMVIGLTIISLLTELVSWIARGKSAPLSFYTVDLFIISIWFFVINGIYTGLHFYNVWQRSEAARQEEDRLRAGGLIVRQGKSDIKLAFGEIAGFYVDGEYAVTCHINGKRFYMDQSLDKLEKILPGVFFRLNRQLIVHRQLVTGFKRAENNKLVVMLGPHECFPPETAVSRTKAPSFKSWFRPG